MSNLTFAHSTVAPSPVRNFRRVNQCSFTSSFTASTSVASLRGMTSPPCLWHPQLIPSIRIPTQAQRLAPTSGTSKSYSRSRRGAAWLVRQPRASTRLVGDVVLIGGVIQGLRQAVRPAAGGNQKHPKTGSAVDVWSRIPHLRR